MKWRSRVNVLYHQRVLILENLGCFLLTVNYTAENAVCLHIVSPRQISVIEYILTGTIVLQARGSLLCTLTLM